MSDLGERVTRLKEPLTLYRGKGCKNCKQSGYRGRSGIYELLLLSEEIKKLISERASTQVTREVAGKTAGLVPLRVDGLKKALKGTTTIEEVDRVAYYASPVPLRLRRHKSDLARIISYLNKLYLITQ